MASHHKCPIWGTDAEYLPNGGADRYDVISARAGGRFNIVRSAAVNIQSCSDQIKTLLTSWIIEQHRFGIDAPLITTYTVDDVEKRQMPSVFERADSLLQLIQSKNRLIGFFVEFDTGFSSLSNEEAEFLAWTSSIEIPEVIALIEFCGEQGWVKHEIAGSGSAPRHRVRLEPAGYARLAKLDGANPQSDRAFVAMWFDPSMNTAWTEGIEPGITDAGYEPVRIDRKEHNNKIDDEIVAEIRRSRFLVADFTQEKDNARGGVYYEAGFAHGLNIPVIFTCREEAISFVHFDTRQYNHITWTTPDELRDKLAKRISATIGDGPHVRR